MMVDFQGMSDREILITVAERQSAMSKSMEKFHEEQGHCNIKIEDRVWNLEINGSKISQDLAVSMRAACNRIDEVEDFVESHKGEDNQSGKTWRDWGIIIALLAAITSVAALLWGKS